MKIQNHSEDKKIAVIFFEAKFCASLSSDHLVMITDGKSVIYRDSNESNQEAYDQYLSAYRLAFSDDQSLSLPAIARLISVELTVNQLRAILDSLDEEGRAIRMISLPMCTVTGLVVKRESVAQYLINSLNILTNKIENVAIPMGSIIQ
jgi:hypothetical protein